MPRRKTFVRSVAAAACALAGSALADPPSALDPNPYAVIRPESVSRFFAQAAVRRVDIAIIGDSNTRHNVTSGHEDGMARGFSAIYGCYATRVDPVGGAEGWAAPTFESSCTQIEPLLTGAPSALLSESLPPHVGFPFSYAYLPPGATMLVTNNMGLGISASHPIDISGRLRWHMTHLVFQPALQPLPTRPGAPAPPPPPEASFVSPCSREQWPGSAYVTYSEAVLPTVSATNSGWHDWRLDVPAGERSPHGILFCLTNLAENSSAVGPFYARWNRVENLDTVSGIAYSPLLYQGGRTTRDAAISLVSHATQPQMTEWFRQVVRLQNGEPMLLVQVIQGANDCGYDYPALVYERGAAPRPPGQWLSGAPTNTRLGYLQNTMSIINRLRDFWVGAGYDERNLFFLIGSYHPHPASWNESHPGENNGPQYRIIREEARPAWTQIATTEENVAFVDGWLLSTPDEFMANGWYRYNLPFYRDHAHLSTPGFTAWGQAVSEAVRRACDCGPSVDIDHNGIREVPDVFAFLSLWFAGDSRANFDSEGDAPAVPDIFAFLTSWFEGCAGH